MVLNSFATDLLPIWYNNYSIAKRLCIAFILLQISITLSNIIIFVQNDFITVVFLELSLHDEVIGDLPAKKIFTFKKGVPMKLQVTE